LVAGDRPAYAELPDPSNAWAVVVVEISAPNAVAAAAVVRNSLRDDDNGDDDGEVEGVEKAKDESNIDTVNRRVRKKSFIDVIKKPSNYTEAREK
jgi:hypothetical protein